MACVHRASGSVSQTQYRLSPGFEAHGIKCDSGLGWENISALTVIELIAMLWHHDTLAGSSCVHLH